MEISQRGNLTYLLTPCPSFKKWDKNYFLDRFTRHKIRLTRKIDWIYFLFDNIEQFMLKIYS